MFVHTYPEVYAILLLVTPPIHYIVFAIPHKRHNTFSERKPAIPRWLSFCNSFCIYESISMEKFHGSNKLSVNRQKVLL